MSSPAPIVALAPKRAPGRHRVSAILAAARAVFAERGYDAATMTEIAARSQTAIGSLYRFFPTKELVAEALLADYAERVGAAFSEVQAEAPALAPAALADALIDLMLRSRADHDVAVALLDGRGDAAELRDWLRRTARRQICGVLVGGGAFLGDGPDRRRRRRPPAAHEVGRGARRRRYAERTARRRAAQARPALPWATQFDGASRLGRRPRPIAAFAITAAYCRSALTCLGPQL